MSLNDTAKFTHFQNLKVKCLNSVPVPNRATEPEQHYISTLQTTLAQPVA